MGTPGIAERQLWYFSFITWLRYQKVIWLWRWGPPTESYYSATFGGHRYCGRADIRLFIYFSFKSIQNKDQISISKFMYLIKTIYLMTIWLTKNDYFIEYLNNSLNENYYFVEYKNNSLNQSNYLVEYINNYFFEYISNLLNT